MANVRYPVCPGIVVSGTPTQVIIRFYINKTIVAIEPKAFTGMFNFKNYTTMFIF